eukprot:g80522.t1
MFHNSHMNQHKMETSKDSYFTHEFAKKTAFSTSRALRPASQNLPEKKEIVNEIIASHYALRIWMINHSRSPASGTSGVIDGDVVGGGN